MYLFDEPKVEANAEEPEPDVETIIYQWQKRPGRRMELEGLPVAGAGDTRQD